VEASALQAPVGVARSRISIGAPLLRLRSDEQLVALFRTGNDDAFRIIHDRYRQRLFAYTRQMLPGSRQDAEDALQDVFVRAYSGLRANDRDVALRAWLYRVAHNRCIDELRRPPVPAPELIELVRAPIHDPIAEAEQRESLRRLIEDVRRLPDQQRSALLMRELSGMSYTELAIALGISVPAVKSLLVRARVGLAQAAEARETACSTIREELMAAHDRRVRPNATARRHLRDCAGCREFRSEIRGVSRQFAALAPTIGPLGMLANLLGIGGSAGGSAAAGGGAAAAGSAAGTTGAFAATGALATGAAGHVATLLAAAVVTAGGAAAVQHSIAATPVKHRAHHHAKAQAKPAPAPARVSASTSQLAVRARPSYVEKPAYTQTAPAPQAKRATALRPKHSENSAPASQTGALGASSTPSTGGDALQPSTTTDPTAGTPSGGTALGAWSTDGAAPPGAPTSSSTPTQGTTGSTSGPTDSVGTSSGSTTPTTSTGPGTGTSTPTGATTATGSASGAVATSTASTTDQATAADGGSTVVGH
jgi:RNA polymerase sigma factor (sigma-70 family)